MDNRKISICIPTFCRYSLTIKAFEKVLHDDRVSEIIISDDASTDDSYEKLGYHFANNKKVHLYQNSVNRDCYSNKYISVGLATNEFVAIIDSDNIIDTDYIDKLYAIREWDKRTIYAPDYAKPNFNYTKFSGAVITRGNVSTYMSMKGFDTAMNTMNYVVCREQFLKCWDGSVVPHTADSLFFNYCWFKSGNSIYIVPGMQYFHLVHEQSHYKLNNHKTGTFYTDIEKLLKQMR